MVRKWLKSLSLKNLVKTNNSNGSEDEAEFGSNESSPKNLVQERKLNAEDSKTFTKNSSHESIIAGRKIKGASKNNQREDEVIVAKNVSPKTKLRKDDLSEDGSSLSGTLSTKKKYRNINQEEDALQARAPSTEEKSVRADNEVGLQSTDYKKSSKKDPGRRQRDTSEFEGSSQNKSNDGDDKKDDRSHRSGKKKKSKRKLIDGNNDVVEVDEKDLVIQNLSQQLEKKERTICALNDTVEKMQNQLEVMELILENSQRMNRTIEVEDNASLDDKEVFDIPPKGNPPKAPFLVAALKAEAYLTIGT
ncbi:unnamed protein product [Pseudo-nitzschia multistriata]|uniref:Uncharacterized protein n=1 Tax=Pseudo-nitzschia multistriata TaxID=183589 RepID=A0A448ZE91_9STRA|nr:unnamed protein product [Pseudo-nitzschia multistriata]